MTETDFDFAMPPHGRVPVNDPDRMPCRWCSTPTLRSTLNHYGARCVECYEQFMRDPITSPDVGDKRIGPLEWAAALQAREKAGNSLTQAQRQMWRDAVQWLSVEASKREIRR